MRAITALAVLAAAATANASIVTFQVGTNGYTTGRDTELQEASPNLIFGSAVSASIDSSNGGGQSQSLLAFDGIIGGGLNQIPAGAVVTSASLRLEIDSAGSGINLHRMLTDWDEAAISWSSAVNGLSADDVEARATASVSIGANNSATNIPSGPLAIDVTGDVQAWANGTANFGWAMLPFVPNGTNGVDFLTREDFNVSTRPLLTVEFVVPEPASLSLLAGVSGALVSRRRK